MKQHLLRLLIVLILAVGVGFTIYFLVKDNSKFYVNDYSYQFFTEKNELNKKIEDLTPYGNDTFLVNKKIYDSLKESLDYLNSRLINTTLTKNEREIVKESFRNLNNEYKNLDKSLISLESYLNETNKSETELSGRKERASADLNKVNKQLYILNNNVENLVLSKIYNDNYLDASFAINSAKNKMINCYFSTLKQKNFVLDTIQKFTELKNNNFKASSSAFIFARNYNQAKENIDSLFLNYYETENADVNFSNLLNFLKSEGYYEKN